MSKKNDRFSELEKAYKDACNNIIKEFSEVYEVFVDDSDWVAGDVGETICVNETYYINFSDICLMLRKHVPFDEYIRYWDYSYDCSFLGLNSMNFRSWVLGAPRIPNESIEKLKKMKEDIINFTKECNASSF